MDKFELGLKYKSDCGNKAYNYDISAHIDRYGMIIIEEDLPKKIMNDIKKKGCFEFPDLDYVEWLEEKLMQVL